MRKSAAVLLFVAAGTGMAMGSAHAANSNADPSKDQPQKHKVVAGESLSSIAADNKFETWRPIWNANTDLQNPDQISPDQELIIPNGPTADRPLPPGYGEPQPVAVSAGATVSYNNYQPVHRTAVPAGGDVFARIRARESGGNYATNTGNGYYGAYQYDDGTWGGYGGYRHASDAPPEVQDAKARETYAARGCSPWPNTCY